MTAEELAALAAAPQSISVDGQTVEERLPYGVIELSEYAAGKKAMEATGSKKRNPFQLLRTVALNPPGSV